MRARAIGLLISVLSSCADEPRRIDVELRDGEDVTVIPIDDLAHGDRIVFRLPSNIVGFSIASFAHEGTVGAYYIVSPSGIRWVDDYRVGKNPELLLSDLLVSVAAVPQTDVFGTMDVEPGDWHVRFGGSIDRAELWIRRTEDGRFRGGTVDVDAYVAPNILDNQESYVRSVLEATFPWVGLTLGDVRYLSLPAEYTVLDASEFEAALTATSGERMPMLNVLFVAMLNNLDGTVRGKAARLPGYSGSRTLASGVAVALEGTLEEDVYILRHEMGHFMGLFHTTDYPTGVVDPLLDTPQCDETLIETAHHECPDAGNLMSPWMILDGLTESQERVIRGSSAYRGLSSAKSMTASISFSSPISPTIVPTEVRKVTFSMEERPMISCSGVRVETPSNGVSCRSGSFRVCLALAR